MAVGAVRYYFSVSLAGYFRNGLDRPIELVENGWPVRDLFG
ncbi:MAG: hypothetical protein JWO38_1219 [Gemmataceae bacterium]|nr:hypothetical protein [Gemmataceae bacterium]